MKESIEGFTLSLENISKDSRIRELKVIEKTKSILKARLYFSDDIFVQVYVNIRRPKKSYAVIVNDIRIFGKDYVFGLWHLHPFESPQKHDDFEGAKKPVTMEEFVEEAAFILSEKLRMI